MCRRLGIDQNQTSPYKPRANERTGRHNVKITEVVLKYCVENQRTSDTVLPYLNFVYNSTIIWITGPLPFSMVHGQECQYPLPHLQLTSSAKPHDKPLTKDGFAEWLDEQFRDAHGSAEELLGMDQRRQKAPSYKNSRGTLCNWRQNLFMGK